MSITPPVVVDAPVPRGLRTGLFAAGVGPRILPDHGSAGGITYEPISCGHAHFLEVSCGLGDLAVEKTIDTSDGQIRANPFVVYASMGCGSVGSSSADLDRKVRQRLANGEQTIAEFGLGLVLSAGATPIAAADPTLTGVVGGLEQWLYGINGAAYGNVGYLHASIRMAAYAAHEELIVHDQGLMKTPMGTIWIFGGGYPDDGTITVSGQVSVWRSAQVYTPPAQLNLQTNQYTIIAEREYAVAYDCVAASSVFDWMPYS